MLKYTRDTDVVIGLIKAFIYRRHPDAGRLL